MKRASLVVSLLAASLAFGAGAARAASFFDDFNSESYGVPGTLHNFSISGSIDVIGSGSSGSGYDFFPTHGYYIDLDGTISGSETPASTLTSIPTFGPGTYKISFDLAGNQRGDSDKTTMVSLGGTSMSYTLASGAAFTTESFTATVTGSPVSLIFTETGKSDNIGNLLDNVRVTGVPLPASAPLFGAALTVMGLVGYGLKRKSKSVSA